MDYFDILLARKLANKGDITTESLSVTENGTYTAPQGKAYTPVNVNVPLPSNAYLLNTVSGLPASIASFTASDAPLNSLKVAITAVQSGSGDPSPTNVRPISGWDEVNVVVNGFNQSDEVWELGDINGSNGENVENSTHIRTKNYVSVKPNTSYYFCCGNEIRIRYYDKDKSFIGEVDASNKGKVTPTGNIRTTQSNCYYIRFVIRDTTTYANNVSVNYPATDTSYHSYNGKTVTIQFGQTVYGGILDVTGGVLTITNVMKVYDGSENWQQAEVGRYSVTRESEMRVIDTTAKANYLVRYASASEVQDGGFYIGGQNFGVKLNDITSVADFKTFLASNNLQVVYELATPTTLTTQPTPIKSLNGTNNLSVDCGEILEGEYFKAL